MPDTSGPSRHASSGHARARSFERNAKLSIPVLPAAARFSDKRDALLRFLNRRATQTGYVLLPSDVRCPRSFGNFQHLVLSALMAAYTLNVRVLAETPMDCNGMLQVMMGDRMQQLRHRKPALQTVELDASDYCERLASPAFALSAKEHLLLPASQHGQETSWCLQLRSSSEASYNTSALFALGPHVAYGAIFGAAFALHNETVPAWRDDEIRISVHIRHFEEEQTGGESISIFEAEIRKVAGAARFCALLVASDRRVTLKLMSGVSKRVGCRLIQSVRGGPVQDFSAEHGEDVGEVVLRDVFLLAHGHILIGTWGSTLTVVVQELIAARSRATRHFPTVTYCSLWLRRCMKTLPLWTDERNHWFVTVGHSGAAHVSTPQGMQLALNGKDWAEWAEREKLKKSERLLTSSSVVEAAVAVTKEKLLWQTGPCNVQLLRAAWRVPRQACVLDETFGCFDGGLRMWVSGTCHGRFRCQQSVVDCGRYKYIVKASRHNCTCGKSASLWPAAEEVVAELARIQWPNEPPLSNAWLGAIISGNSSSHRYHAAAESVRSCGFTPMLVRAAMPYHYADLGAMMKELFGDANRRATKMSAYELGLLISHKRALAMIAQGPYQWGGVFEDDSYLHEAIKPWQASHLIQRAFQAAGDGRALYLGACAPSCLEKSGAPKQLNAQHPETIYGGFSAGLLQGGRCRAYCSHAYAVGRKHASTLFADVFDCRKIPERCGLECKHRPCFMDWALYRHFTRGHDAWVVGGGLRSQWVPDHRGLFIQNRSALLGNNVSGTNLGRRFHWRFNNPTVSRVERHCPPQSRQVGNGSSSSEHPRLRKIVVTPRWSGRLGNLLFEWGTLMGITSRLRAIAHTEAITFKLPSSVTVPARELFLEFPLFSNSIHSVDGPGGNISIATPDGAFGGAYKYEREQCTACVYVVEETRANAYEEDKIRQLEAWAASPPASCQIGLVELVGYFQSFKYFNDVADRLIRPAMARLAPSTKQEALAIIGRVRRTVPFGRVIGVQVRLGDKVRGKLKPFYAQTSWDYYRAGMRHLARGFRSRHSGARVDVSFVITAGGSMGNNSVDVADARRHLASSGERVYFSTAENPYVDLAVLQRCDALVISSSSLGWWAAYLSGLPEGRIVAPRHIINQKLPSHHKLIKGFSEADYYPSTWTLLPNDGKGFPAFHARVGRSSAGAAAHASLGGQSIAGTYLWRGRTGQLNHSSANRTFDRPALSGRFKEVKPSKRKAVHKATSGQKFWTAVFHSLALTVTITFAGIGVALAVVCYCCPQWLP